MGLVESTLRYVIETTQHDLRYEKKDGKESAIEVFSYINFSRDGTDRKYKTEALITFQKQRIG